ncbi:MAG: PQQ-binding-like beta-propeller repeat protein, partial [Anaerolineaceae bacterium]|nr:PQQ-binding-like beta-propeller repeat protein [Anaerolineaceae bacterium]
MLTLIAASGTARAGDGQWTHRGNTNSRNSVAQGLPPDIAAQRFIASVPGVELVGQSAPVVADHMVFVYGQQSVVQGDAVVKVNEVLAFSEIDGHLVWSQPVGDEQWDSHTAPTVDLARGNVLIASGTVVTALDMATGDVAWETTLGTRPVVNSSICVLGDRAFIIDYTGALPGATLYALNLDPGHPALVEGEVAWTQPINKGSGCEVAVDASGGGPMLVATDSDG